MIPDLDDPKCYLGSYAYFLCSCLVIFGGRVVALGAEADVSNQRAHSSAISKEIASSRHLLVNLEQVGFGI